MAEKTEKEQKKLPEKIYRELMDNPFIGVCVTDGTGTVVACNGSYSRITSVSAERIIGKTMKSLITGGLFSESSSLEVIKKKKPVLINQTLSNGRSRVVKSVPIFGDEGKVEFVISYLMDVSELQRVKEKLLEEIKAKEKITYEYEALRKSLEGQSDFVHQSDAMGKAIALTKKVAKTDAAILITGPSGSGKELLAQLLHNESKRKDAPFVKINCSAIPENLLETELFGYEGGAFTGGKPKGEIGLFEYATGGTILLDEIGDMPLSLQAKLLRVLQDQEIRRVGGHKSLKVDARVIASTNADLSTLIAEKNFREDLYYRINVVRIKCPGLGERKEDIPLLIAYFMRMFNMKYNESRTMDYDAVNFLSSLNYPGNVRELKNIVERLIIQTNAPVISIKDIQEAFSYLDEDVMIGAPRVSFEIKRNLSLKEIMEEYEKEVLKEYFRTCGSMTNMAKSLKVDLSTIFRKLRKYDLE